MISSSPVGTARPSSILLMPIRMPVTAPVSPSPRISSGERRKRSSTRRSWPCGSRAAYSRISSTLRLLVGSPSLLQPLRAVRVELQVGGVDDDVRARELAQLAQLRRGERGLRGPAAAEHDHFVDGGGAERRDRVVGGVGDRHLLRVEHEHAGDVDGHVAVADDHRARGGEVELVVGVVRVAVVPGHELQRAVRAGAVLARDAELVVGRRADRVRAPRGSGPAGPGGSRARRARRRRRSGSPDGSRSSRRRA